MSVQQEKLLMFFIRDLYKSSRGKISKQTAIKAMQFVAEDEALQGKVGASDWKAVVSHTKT